MITPYALYGSPGPSAQHAAAWTDGHVTVRWRLIDMSGTITFDVTRTEGDTFRRLDAADVVTSGDEYVFVDDATEPGRTYRYRVTVFEDGDAITSFDATVATPSASVTLEQNHPNPFNPTTVISFFITSAGHVSLEIYDSAGRSIRTLVDGVLPAGSRAMTWDGRDDNARPVVSGVYFYRLQTGKQVLSRKAVLLK